MRSFRLTYFKRKGYKVRIKKAKQILFRFFVGVAGFEPAASTSQTWRDNRATLHPEVIINSIKIICGETGIRTPGTLLGYDDLANRSFRPLRHLSNTVIRTSHLNADANVSFHLKANNYFI